MRERAERPVLDTRAQHPSRWQAIMSIAAKIGCTPQTLSDRVKKAEVDNGLRTGIPSGMAEKMKVLERENRKLRLANKILRKASAYSAMLEGSAASLRAMPERIDRRSKWGSGSSTAIEGSCQWWRRWSEPHWRRVEPICNTLPIAPSTYHDHLAKRADPARRADRDCRDEDLRHWIQRVFEGNWSVYDVRKVWHQLRREKFDVSRCTVARLMKDMGILGLAMVSRTIGVPMD